MKTTNDLNVQGSVTTNEVIVGTKTIVDGTGKIPFAQIKNTPTTLSGYGITDAISKTDLTSDSTQDLLARSASIRNTNASNYVASSAIYKVVDHRREDGTLSMRSSLNDPNANGNFQTLIMDFYDAGGSTILQSQVWHITYDAEGKVISKTKV